MGRLFSNVRNINFNKLRHIFQMANFVYVLLCYYLVVFCMHIRDFEHFSFHSLSSSFPLALSLFFSMQCCALRWIQTSAYHIATTNALVSSHHWNTDFIKLLTVSRLNFTVTWYYLSHKCPHAHAHPLIQHTLNIKTETFTFNVFDWMKLI